MRYVVLAVLAACARPPAPHVADSPVPRPADATRHFTIWLGGARIGTAEEREIWTRDGVTLARRERMQFLRGETAVALTTVITVDASAALVPRRVRWQESAAETRSAEATHGDDGWTLSTGDALAGDAVPAELVPLLVRRDGAYDGPIFLPARGFVSGSGRVQPVADGRLVARITLDAGPVVEATIDLGTDGSPARIVDGEGVIALRATADEANTPFTSVDLIAATSLPIGGTRRTPRVVLHTATGETTATLVADRASVPREIRDAVAAVRARIAPSLGAGPTSTRDAAFATAGDCTTFALAYAAYASERGIATKIVTGLRLDDGNLIRHRWALSWTGSRWIAVDAAFDQVPAGDRLIAVATHDADDAGLVAGEAALTQIRGATWAP